VITINGSHLVAFSIRLAGGYIILSCCSTGSVKFFFLTEDEQKVKLKTILKTQEFTFVGMMSLNKTFAFYNVCGGLMVLMRDPCRGMGALRNSTETQHSGHILRYGLSKRFRYGTIQSRRVTLRFILHR